MRFLGAGAGPALAPNSGGGGAIWWAGAGNSSGGRENSKSGWAMGDPAYLLCTSTWGKGHSTPRERKPSHKSRFRVRAPE